jgi:hypothetical protein
MVTGLLACGAELLAVIFQHLPASVIIMALIIAVNYNAKRGLARPE